MPMPNPGEPFFDYISSFPLPITWGPDFRADPDFSVVAKILRREAPRFSHAERRACIAVAEYLEDGAERPSLPPSKDPSKTEAPQETPALDVLLGRHLSVEVSGRGPTECVDCPFGKISNRKAILRRTTYHCSLLDEEVWGESPQCFIEDWQRRAREEIRSPSSSDKEGRYKNFLLALVEEEDEPCRFDHHGYCQEHGWFGEPGECGIGEARKELGLA